MFSYCVISILLVVCSFFEARRILIPKYTPQELLKINLKLRNQTTLPRYRLLVATVFIPMFVFPFVLVYFGFLFDIPAFPMLLLGLNTARMIRNYEVIIFIFYLTRKDVTLKYKLTQ